MDQNKLQIGIIGTGAIGGFYGAMLAQGGNDVHFLLRSEYDAVVEKGITINSLVNEQLHLHPVQAYKDAADMPPCDWLFIGAKSTAGNLGDIITRAGKPDAKVVLLQNGLSNEDQLRPFLPDTMHLIGGLCYVCLFREGPGLVKHQANGMVDLGYHSGPATTVEAQQALLKEGAELLASGKIPTRLLPGVDEARWQKLVWNAPFNGISVVLNSGTQALLKDPASNKLIKEMMEEVISTARAKGISMPDGLADKLLMGTGAMPDYQPSMYHDWLHKRPMELDSLYGELLRQGREAGCSLPKIEAMLDQLTFIQNRYLSNQQEVRMPSQLGDKLVIAISSRALFDLDDSHAVFEREGLEAYRLYQIAHEDEPLEPGEAFPLVQKLLRINSLLEGDSRVEVVLISRNSADTGLRVFNSIQHYGLGITRAAFAGGRSPFTYIPAFGCQLFLSTHAEDVRATLEAGFAAATILPAKRRPEQRDELRIAFDGDAVLFSDESEQVFQRDGLAAFQASEQASAHQPLRGGPFKAFLAALNRIQTEFPNEQCPIRTALVTARSAPAHERVIRTLREWDIRLDESLFLGGLDKSEFLQAFGADLFFDDQEGHCQRAVGVVPTGHVPHGISNLKSSSSA